MIHVKEINTKKEMEQFVKFPFSLYKNNPNWVPTIIADELETFNSLKNPVFEHATARFFLAIKNDTIVGRIAAIINTYEVKNQNIKKMRFGWYDTIDDLEVSKALLEKVKEIGFQNNLEYVEGPVGFNNLDKTGVLTYGFDHIGTMITWYHNPYQHKHLEKLGFIKEKEYLENKFSFSKVDVIKYGKAASIIKKRYQLKALNFSSTKNIMPYVDEMFDLFSKTYSKLSTYVPISQNQIAYFKKKYISFINPEYIKFVIDKEGKLVAFAIVMPSFSKALQKANGKLFPFGIFHLLKARKKAKDVTFYLIGVHPDYQNKGVIAIIFEEFHKTFTAKGIVNCIRTPELEDNTAIHQIWKGFDPVTHKRRRTYKLSL